MSNQEIPLGANQPFFLDRHDRAWRGQAGGVELFYADLDPEGNFRSPRNFLYRAGTGDLLLSLHTQAHTEGLTLMAVSHDARLEETSLEQLLETAPETLVEPVEDWVIKLAASLYEGSFPRIYQPLEPGNTLSLRK